jgi:hypothetical protein
MKKLLLFLAAIAMTACEKVTVIDDTEPGTENAEAKTKKFTFTMKGEFTNPTFTRGYLATDNAITDLWVFDYMDGTCMQSLHQTPNDEAWGEPKMQLKYGSHHIYFVASRGDSPTLDEDTHSISWVTTRDTYWKDYEVEVVSTTNGNRAVTLDRVATKLKISVTDEVPSNLSSIIITPDTWYYGLDYVTGNATTTKRQSRAISIPASYAGTSGQLSASIFGISNDIEWLTDITIESKGTNGETISEVIINDAPFKRNRATEYTGSLFRRGEGFALSLEDDWNDPYNGNWQ